MTELWLFFPLLADSPDPKDRENCLLLELETESLKEMIEKIPTELLTSEHIFLRGFPNRIEIEVHL